MRPVDEERDLALLAGWFADPAFVEHWGAIPLTREQVAVKYAGRRRPRVESFVVLAGEQPVGYAQYWSAPTAGEGGLDVVLIPEARGCGYGPRVAETLVAHLLGERGWTRVTVDPVVTNPRAVRAWEKAGFRPVRRDGDELIMERVRGRRP